MVTITGGLVLSPNDRIQWLGRATAVGRESGLEQSSVS
jgi:hypothetical protein